MEIEILKLIIFYWMENNDPILIDFGLSIIKEPDNSNFTSKCGTTKYLPPKNSTMTDKADIWCFGLAILEMFGELKTDSNNLPIIHTHLSNECKEVLEQLLGSIQIIGTVLNNYWNYLGLKIKIYFQFLNKMMQIPHVESDKRTFFNFYINTKEITETIGPYELNIKKEFNENQNYLNYLLSGRYNGEDISSMENRVNELVPRIVYQTIIHFPNKFILKQK
ncbi:hypothetical protein ACTFIT_006875 [Dictyostelium discoideum]